MKTVQSKSQNTRKFGITPSFVGWLSRSIAAATLAAIGIGGQSASAAIFDWDPAIDLTNSGSTGTWDTLLGNWNSAGVDGAWGNTAADVANFGGTGGIVTINTGATGVIANGLTFNVNGYTINGFATTEELSLQGATPAITVTNAAHTATINAVISGTSLTANGAGTLVLGGANTYTGATTISSGTVKLGNAAGLGSTAAGTTIASGAVLDLNGQAVGAEAVAISGTGISSGGALINNNGTAASLSGAVTLNAASSVGGSGGLTLSGGIGGAFDFNKVGSGTVSLTAASVGRTTAAATTTVSGGVLSLQNATAIGTSGTANSIPVSVSNVGTVLEVKGGITLDNGLSITLNDGATLRSDGTNTINGRVMLPTAVGANTVTISAVGVADTFTLGNGSNDVSGGNGTDDTIVIAGLGKVLASNSSDYIGAWSVNSGTLQLGATAALGAGATTKVALNGGNLSGLLASNTTFTGPGANGINVTASSTVTSDRSSAGAGVTYTYGPLAIGAQTLTAAAGSGVTSGTAGITFGATTLSGAPTFALGASTLLTLGAVGGTTTNVNFSGLGAASLGALTLSGASSVAVGTGTTLTLAAVSGAGNNLTFTGAGTTTVAGIISTTTGTLNINGGTVTLSNTGNSFTGSINIDGASSVLAYAGTGGSADPAVLGSGAKYITVTNGGTVRVTSSISNPTAGGKNYVVGAGGGTFDVSSGATFTLDDGTGNGLGGTTAQLQGSTTLTKAGTGILQLGYSGQAAGGFSNFTGNIIINAGTLQVGNSNGLGTGAGSTTTVNSGGALDFYSSSSTVGDDISLSGSGPTGAGALLASGTLSGTLTGAVTLTGNTTIGNSNTGALTLNGVVSGGFSLTKVGTGTGVLTLASAANTYTGFTVVQAGTLAVGSIGNVGAGNTGAGNVTTVSGGTIAVGGTAATGTLVVNAAVDSSTDRVIDLAGTTFGGGVGSSGAAAVVFTSNPTYTGVGNKQFILAGTNTNDNKFLGLITDGSGSVIGLDKSGAGTWALPISNNYSGTTNLTGGVLSITNMTSLGNTTGGTLQSGASELRLSGGIAVGAETLTINGGGISNFGALRSYSGNNSWGGAVTLAAISRINSDSGTLTMGNTITGTAGGLVVGGGGNVTLNGALSLGTGVLAKGDGTGTLTLNANATYTGATTVSVGKLLLGPGGNLVGVTAATVASGATLAVGQSADASTNTLGGALTVTAGGQVTMADGFISTLAVTGATTIGGTSASSLTFDLGGVTTAADRINATGTAIISAAGATIAINPIGATAATLNSYNLITGGASSTLTTNPLTLSTTKIYLGGTPYALSLTNAATTVNLNVAAFTGLDTAYWKGDISSTWTDLSSGSNWDTTEAGAVDALAFPTSVTDVFIHATGAANLTNTLGADFTINSLNYTAASTTSTIGAGNTLTLAAAGAGNIGINVASGAAAHTISANIALGQSQTWNNSSANALTIGKNITGAGTLTKAGSGALVLGGFGSNAGGLTVNAGTVSLTGTYSAGLAGQVNLGNMAGNSALSISGGNLLVVRTTAPSISIGNNNSSVNALNMSSGSLTTASDVWVGNAASGYGALTITGGTANIGSWLAIGRGGHGALNVGGGTLNVLTNNITVGTLGGGGGNTNDVVNFSGSSTTNVFAGGLFLPEQQAGHVVVANISGSTSVNLGAGVSFGQGGAQLNSGVLNLNGGTLTTKSILKGTGTGSYLLNLNGGTLKAQIGATAGFLTGLTSAYVNSGGAIFDTNGQNITVAQALLTTSGNGVSATGLTLGGTNSGYIDTPVVSITGGGGIGATAVANINYSTGVVTGITITNPGNGYTTAPTFSLIGGGGAATIGGAATLAANVTTGGLTKNGAGVLDLFGANTYTGATVVNGGGISIGNTYATSGFTFASGTTLSFSNTANLTIPQNLTLTTALSKTVTNVSTATTLTGTNTFSGINIAGNNGIIQFNSAASFGLNGGRTVLDNANIALSFAGASKLQPYLLSAFNGTSGGSVNLTSSSDLTENLDFSAASGANQTSLHLGAQVGTSLTYTGTITPNSGVYRLGGGGGTLTLSNLNALTGSNSLNIHGVSGGTVFLTNTNNYTGGTTFVGNSGTLNFINGALGGGAISFSSPNPALQWATGNTQDVSASRTITINTGSVFNLDTNGNNITLGSPIGNGGAGGLIKNGAGILTLNAANTFTGGTTINNVASSGIKLGAANALQNSTLTNSLALGLTFAPSIGTFMIGGLAGTQTIALADTGAAAVNLQIGGTTNNTAQTYSGVMSGIGSVVKIGAYAQSLSSANTYTGATTVQMGNLTTGQLNSSNLNLVFAASNLTNRIAATSALTLGGSIATDAQTILGGGTLTLTGAASITNSQTVASTTIGVGGNNLVIANNATANPTALVMGTLTRNIGGVVNFTQPTGTLAATNGFQTATGTASTILTSAAGTAYATIGAATGAVAADWAGKDSTNAWVAPVTYLATAAAATYATATLTSNVDVTTGFTATGNQTVGTLRIGATTAQTLNLGTGFTTTVDKGGVLFGSTGTTIGHIITGGIIRPGVGSELVFINSSTGTPQINSVISNPAAGSTSVTYRSSIQATGLGQLTLGATNTYTGPTYITSGRVNTNATLQPFGSGKVYIDGNTNGQWLANGAVTITNPFFITGNGWSEVGGPFGAIRIENGITLSGAVTLLGDAGIGAVNTGSATISGPISGAFNLTKSGGQPLNLTGTNTSFTGKYNAFAGNIVFNTANAYGAATGIILSGGLVAANFADMQTNLINKIVQSTPATLANGAIGVTATNVAENVNFASTILDMSNVYLGAGASGLTYTGTITPYNNAYKIGGGGVGLTFSNMNAFTDNGAIPRSVTTRSNTVLLTSTNNYSGGTTLNSGGINFVSGALGSGSLTLSGGTLTWATGNTQDITASRAVTVTAATSFDTGANNVTLASPLALNTTGALTKAGAGTLTLSAVSTTGITTPSVTVTAGGLTLATTNALPVYTTLGLNNTVGVVVTLGGNQTIGGLGNNGSLTFSSAASLVLGGNALTYGYNNTSTNTGTDAVISGNGNLIKVGTGSEYLRSLETFTGNLEVNNGYQMLELAQVALGSSNIIPATTGVTLSGGTLQVLGNTAAASVSTQTITSAVILNPGASAVGTLPRAGQTTNLVLTAGFTRNAGSTVNVLTNGGGSSFIGNGASPISSITTTQLNTDYTSAGGNQSILGGYAGFSSVVPTVNVVNPPTTWAVTSNVAGSNAVTGLASFNSTYTAGTNVDSAIGNVSIGAAALTVNSLRFNTAGAYQIDAANGLSIASGGILATATVAANPITILNGTLTSGNGADLIIHHYTTGDLIIGSKITGNIGLTKSGTGRLILNNGANDYTGSTYVNAGILRYNASTTATSAAAIVHSGAAIELTDGVTVTGQTATVYGGGSGTFFGALNTAYGSATWAGGVVIGDIDARIGSAANATLTVSGNIVDGATVNGVLNNKLYFSGASGIGTVVLSGAANTYSGPTAIIRGIVRITGNNTLPTTTTLDVHSGASNFGFTTDAAIFDLNGYNQTVAGLARTDTTGTGSIVNWAAGTSTLTLNNATANTFSGTITEAYGKIAFVKSGAGNLTLSGSNSFSGGLTINGGTLFMGNVNAIGSQAQPNSLTMTGGTLDASGVAQISVTSLSGAGGTITDSGTTAGTTTLATYDNANATYGGVIANGTARTLALTKQGAGNLTVTAASTYTGVTEVLGGTLTVSGSISGSATIVASGATLTGSGTVGAATVLSGGILAPGNTVGTLSTNGALTLSSGSAINIEVATTSSYDAVNVTGTVNLGSSTLNLSGAYFTPTVTTDTFFIVLNDGADAITGTFSGITDGSHVYAANGQDYLISYFADSGTNSFTGGNDVALLAVPEPASVTLMLGGLAMIAGARRRRKQS